MVGNQRYKLSHYHLFQFTFSHFVSPFCHSLSDQPLPLPCMRSPWLPTPAAHRHLIVHQHIYQSISLCSLPRLSRFQAFLFVILRLRILRVWLPCLCTPNPACLSWLWITCPPPLVWIVCLSACPTWQCLSACPISVLFTYQADCLVFHDPVCNLITEWVLLLSSSLFFWVETSCSSQVVTQTLMNTPQKQYLMYESLLFTENWSTRLKNNQPLPLL